MLKVTIVEKHVSAGKYVGIVSAGNMKAVESAGISADGSAFAPYWLKRE